MTDAGGTRGEPDASGGLARRGGLALVGIVAQGLTRFLTTLLVGNMAGPVVLGHVSSALSLSNLLSFFWPTTSGSAAAKFVARADGAGTGAGPATIRHLRVRVLQSGVLLAAVGVGGWLTWTADTVIDAVVVGAMTLACCLYPLSRGVLLSTGGLRRSAVLDSLAGVLAVGGVAALLALGIRSQVLLVPMSLGLAVYVAFAWARGEGNLPREVRREIDGFVLLGTIGTLCGVGFLQLSVLAARVVGGPFAAGQYSAALAIATPAALAANALGLVLFPEMARAHGRGDVAGVAAQARAATGGLVLLLVPVVATVALSSPLLFAVLWGPEFEQGAALLPVLVVGVVMTAVATPSVNSLTSGDQSGLRFTTTLGLLGAGAGVVLWLALTPALSLVGVALGYAGGTGAAAVGAIVASSRRHHQTWDGLWLRTSAYSAGVGAACAVLLTGDATWPWLLSAVATSWAAWYLLHRVRFAALFRSLVRRPTR